MQKCAMERKYEFRKKLLCVHKPNRRDEDVFIGEDELEIHDSFTIITDECADRVVEHAAADFQEYLLTSMNVGVRRKKTALTPEAYKNAASTIVLVDLSKMCPSLNVKMDGPSSYTIKCDQQKIIVYGHDARGVAQGIYYLEDRMNIRKAPFVRWQETTKRPLFSPRMIHSGYGLDMFPDAHLNAIAHAGMDAILLFVKDVDTTPHGYQDFNELIDRAAGFGIDVYAYSYLKSLKHPNDESAKAYYDSTYGRLFKECPGFKGIVMVGESVEFPSKDPNTSGKFHYENTEDGLPTGKPSPGWWPCYDYPAWLDMIKNTVRMYKHDADIVFWTYNWGYVDEEHRIKLLENIPTDISLLVTFEMFEKRQVENTTSICVDYTLSFEGPGRYFTSEAKIAKKRGIRLYTMSNTGGLTWDIGVIPYEPCPYQWAARYQALHDSREKYGLCGLMESHHFGFWPSFISEAAKASYWSGAPSFDTIIEEIIERDFNRENVSSIRKAYQLWSKGIRDYIPTNEDQYGPFRIGPSYPLVFRASVEIPTVPYAMFGGNRICNPQYTSSDASRSSLFQHRLPVEIRSLERMRKCFEQGLDEMERVQKTLDPKRYGHVQDQIRLGRFIVCCTTTVIHVKKWAILKYRVLVETDEQKIRDMVDQLIALGEQEIENAESAIPLVEQDSRLGWEPSMEYMTDAAHIRWKIKQVRRTIDHELRSWVQALSYNRSEE